jgi:hypothetical protein
MLGAAKGLSLVNCAVDAVGVIVEVTEVFGAAVVRTALPHPAKASPASRTVAGKRN